jgi:hypothetical protein
VVIRLTRRTKASECAQTGVQSNSRILAVRLLTTAERRHERAELKQQIVEYLSGESELAAVFECLWAGTTSPPDISRSWESRSGKRSVGESGWTESWRRFRKPDREVTQRRSAAQPQPNSNREERAEVTAKYSKYAKCKSFQNDRFQKIALQRDRIAD